MVSSKKFSLELSSGARGYGSCAVTLAARVVAMVWVPSLAWELPHARGMAEKKKRGKKKISLLILWEGAATATHRLSLCHRTLGTFCSELFSILNFCPLVCLFIACLSALLEHTLRRPGSRPCVLLCRFISGVRTVSGFSGVLTRVC